MRKKNNNSMLLIGVVVACALAIVYFGSSTGNFVQQALGGYQTAGVCVLDGTSIFVWTHCESGGECYVYLDFYKCGNRRIDIPISNVQAD